MIILTTHWTSYAQAQRNVLKNYINFHNIVSLKH